VYLTLSNPLYSGPIDNYHDFRTRCPVSLSDCAFAFDYCETVPLVVFSLQVVMLQVRPGPVRPVGNLLCCAFGFVLERALPNRRSDPLWCHFHTPDATGSKYNSSVLILALG
jgi:hypothetical protein